MIQRTVFALAFEFSAQPAASRKIHREYSRRKMFRRLRSPTPNALRSKIILSFRSRRIRRPAQRRRLQKRARHTIRKPLAV